MGERKKCKINHEDDKIWLCHAMVRGCMKSIGRSKLVKVDENLKSENYISLLQSSLLAVNEDGEIIMHNAAPCHTSRVRKILLVDQEVQLLVHWSAKRTDLNIIELFC